MRIFLIKLLNSVLKCIWDIALHLIHKIFSVLFEEIHSYRSWFFDIIISYRWLHDWNKVENRKDINKGIMKKIFCNSSTNVQPLSTTPIKIYGISSTIILSSSSACNISNKAIRIYSQTTTTICSESTSSLFTLSK